MIDLRLAALALSITLAKTLSLAGVGYLVYVGRSRR